MMDDYSFDLGGIGDYSGYDPLPVDLGNYGSNSPIDSYDFSDNLGIDWTNYDGSGGDFSFDPSDIDYSGYDETGSSDGGWLSKANQFLNGVINGNGSYGGNLLNNLLALGGGAYDLYNGYNQNSQGLESMKLQNQVTQAALKSNANNDYRAFTNDAGGYTNDALTSSMIAPRYDMLATLLAGDENFNFSPNDRSRLTSSFADISNRYTPVYEGYANDMVNRRNEQYAAPYNSNAPFPEQMGIPEGTDPQTINAYLESLGVA